MSYEATITDFVVGDDLEIERTVLLVPSGQTITTAWFTVREYYADASPVIIKSINTVNVAGSGYIQNTGSTGSGLMYFYLLPDDTILLTPFAEYLYDIKLKLSGGKYKTVEKGTLVAFNRVNSI